MNTFKECLKIEKDNQSKANHFIYDLYKVSSFKRWDWDKPHGRIMQRKDIDVSVNYSGFKDSCIHISEKFRQADMGDMLIEIISVWEGQQFGAIQGWGLKDDADLIHYYTPFKTYVVNNKQLAVIANKIYRQIFSLTTHKDLMDFFKDDKQTKAFTYITILDERYDIEILKIPTYVGEDRYYGICAAVTWRDLKEMGVDVIKYDSIY